MQRTLGLVGGVLVVLAAATLVVQILKRRSDAAIDPAIVETFRRRVRAWWILTAVLAAAWLIGITATVVLFGLMAFWALREFITLTPTRPGDHRTLFWVFFLFTPLQFVLVGLRLYGLYTILIPVYVFLLIPARIAMSGDPKRFLERTAKIQAGILICVYCLSYAPALMTLRIPRGVSDMPWRFLKIEAVAAVPANAAPANPVPANPAPAPAGGESPPEANPEERHPPAGLARSDLDPEAGPRLLFFFILMVQLSDALQYAWAQIPRKHVIVPTIHPTKTWEGLLGGTASVTLIGAALWWATPFEYWVAGLMSAVIALMGFAGSLTMSAIKRDRGVKDYGTLVEGHSGVLDRIDSICFAAPVFFHFTRYYLILKGVLEPIV